MSQLNIRKNLESVVDNMPSEWLNLTTHRLDIYNERLAKVEFIENLKKLSTFGAKELAELPTAYDYIRLGHPLSCVLEWVMAEDSQLNIESVISFSSQVMPIMATLRRNHLLKKNTRVAHNGNLPASFNPELIKKVYGYQFEVIDTTGIAELDSFEGLTIGIGELNSKGIDIKILIYPGLGSVALVLNNDGDYIKEIQHVRRRESIAMTPQNCLALLNEEIGRESSPSSFNKSVELRETIQRITKTNCAPSVGNCGLSVQYAIMMGLVEFAIDHHIGKAIKFIVPPNCYGGTNDQARRVAACLENVEIVDLPVDSGKDMVQELERILAQAAASDEVPYIIAEIPTNPRVEIPDLENLRATLKKSRQTNDGNEAVKPVFILDQTFCPNVEFFGEAGFLHDAGTISYVSGSKFPSGGLCTAGYCVANESAGQYMSYVDRHLVLCDNIATDLQVNILSQEMPSMNERIAKAYANTRSFVEHMHEKLPEVKINFVSHELANATFTPSVFSLDLPTKGETSEQKESYKRELNHKLIRMMIEALPNQSKHCVSYGQLKGCYWTIPATSTQGTTKESDKDYIVRISVAADFDLAGHKKVFDEFCSKIS